MKEQKKNKLSLSTLLTLLLWMVVGGVCGALIGKLTAEHGALVWAEDMSAGAFALRYGLVLLLFVLAIYLQLILHEGGHLVAGFATGYKFVSFRIGNLMLKKSGDGFQWKKLHLAGTAGQCLMSPPERSDGRFPYVLYNLGGSLMNLLTGGIALGLYRLWGDVPYLSELLLGLLFAGFIFAVTNGVPIHTKLITNDGYNAIALGKDPAARKAFWVQLKINERQMEGERLGAMPADWFELPPEADLKNPMISAVAVFAENRLMDEHRFPEAAAKIDELQSGRCQVIGLYDALLTLDRVTLDILQRGRDADLSPLSEKQTVAFLRQMKQYPSVIRTEYAAALVQGEEKAAADALRRFERVSRSHPAPGEIASERELMEMVREHSSGQLH